LLVTSVVLYGCEIWGSNISTCKWRHLERIHRQLITSNIIVKATVPYEIILAEIGNFSLEATTITKLISYLKKVESMDNQRWPKLAMEKELDRRKKTWMKKNKKWLSKWNIKLYECPNTKEATKKFVNETFRTTMWINHSECKKAYYIKEFNPNCNHREKKYLGVFIKGKEILLVA
jgi:hypothetical protein